VQLPRSSGILLHPTSLPGPYGIGGIGSEARRFVNWLAACGQRYWQILPLAPTGFGNSPYMSYSAFAGNPLLIDPEDLLALGLIDKDDLEPCEVQRAGWGQSVVDFEGAAAYKARLIETALGNVDRLDDEGKVDYEEFCAAEGWWLDDYALFMALKEVNGDLPWPQWAAGVALREPPAIAAHTRELQQRIQFYRLGQYLFACQWAALKRYANDRGVHILGDLPIYVSADSADVWAHPNLFRLDADGNPAVVAGVPPDYFSATGQLWGNPLYDWDAMARTDYRWWINRFRRALAGVDLVRIDHFRGFESFWEVPADEKTAINGRWVEGPGYKLFDAVERGLGGLPLVAEDLGIITPAVEALRDHYGLHGMRVLQFAFDGDARNTHLPHSCTRTSIVYTGTHDNDTTVGWFATAPDWVRRNARDYLNLHDSEPIHWALVRAALATVANVAIVPLQDLLGLGTEARMNTPSTAEGNWSWRCTDLGALDGEIRNRLSRLTGLYGRWPA